jgi:hypothetical protein
MKRIMLQEKYPMYTLEIPKTETSLADVDAIIAKLRRCVEGHEIARMIGEFDHHAHTSALTAGEIAANIQAAKHIRLSRLS